MKEISVLVEATFTYSFLHNFLSLKFTDIFKITPTQTSLIILDFDSKIFLTDG